MRPIAATPRRPDTAARLWKPQRNRSEGGACSGGRRAPEPPPDPESWSDRSRKRIVDRRRIHDDSSILPSALPGERADAGGKSDARSSSSGACGDAQAAFRFSAIPPDPSKQRSLSFAVEDVRWCSRILGETRNLDVFLTMARDLAIDVRQIERGRDRGYARVSTMLKSRRFRRMMSRLLRWLLIGKWRRRASAAQAIDGFAARRLEKAWLKISNPSLGLSQMTEERRHRFRLRTKQFRYVLEFLRSISPDPEQQTQAISRNP